MSTDEIDSALRVLEDFRAAHQVSLTTAYMGLKSMASSENCEARLSQRLKRRETILDKLSREPTLALANMQDIAGCRAVVQTIDELKKIQRRLQHRRPVIRSNDYISKPRLSGYRAVHVVVDYHGRRIEVQLRTVVMHEWAIAVERLGVRLKEDLKSGRGPKEVLVWLATVSQAMATEEQGNIVDASQISEIERLREQAARRLRGG